MTQRARHRLTAWLGMIAMCLVAFAPTVSHFVRAARVVDVPVCTADGVDGPHRVALFSGPRPGVTAMPMSVMAASSLLAMGDMHGRHAMHHGGGTAHDMDGHPDSGSSQPMDDCGYCDLLHHAPAMLAVPLAPLAPLLFLFVFFLLPALTRYTPFGAFPSGRPRAPPAVS